MCKIDYHDVKAPAGTPGEDLTLVRKPVDTASGKEYEKCRYAFFPTASCARTSPRSS